MSSMPSYTNYGEEQDYYLPHGNKDFEETLDILRGIPRAKLEKLVNNGWIKLSDYTNDDKRRKYLASHIVANELGLASPGFRAILRQRSLDSLSEVEQLVARDRQLIDLHYLYCHHRWSLRFRDHDRTVDFLRRSCTEFDYDAAMQFACIGGRKSIKTQKMLAIPEHIQMKLNYYQSDKIRKQVERANEKCQEVCAELDSYAKSSRCRLKPDKLEQLKADILPLLLARGEVRLAIELKFSMPGVEPDDVYRTYSTAMSESKRWFGNWRVQGEHNVASF